jgi:hypothetical protein
MKKFNFKQVGETHFKTSKRVNIQVSAIDNSLMKPADIRYLIQQFEKKYPNSQFLVTGLGVAGLHELGDNTKYQTSTLKKFSTSFNLLDEEEYLDGRVRDETKFLQYFQFNISIVTKGRQRTNAAPQA